MRSRSAIHGFLGMPVPFIMPLGASLFLHLPRAHPVQSPFASPPTHFIRYPYGGAQKQLRTVVLPQLSSRSVAAWIRLMPTPCGFDNRLHIWILNLPAEFLLGLR